MPASPPGTILEFAHSTTSLTGPARPCGFSIIADHSLASESAAPTALGTDRLPSSRMRRELGLNQGSYLFSSPTGQGLPDLTAIPARSAITGPPQPLSVRLAEHNVTLKHLAPTLVHNFRPHIWFSLRILFPDGDAAPNDSAQGGHQETMIRRKEVRGRTLRQGGYNRTSESRTLLLTRNSVLGSC